MSNTNNKVVFTKVPTSLTELEAMAESTLTEPHFAPALLIPALSLWTKNKDEAIKMINFLKGPSPLSNYEIRFISERLDGKEYIPRSYYDGATPENDYEGSVPLTVTVSTTPASFHEENYGTLYLKSGGADSARPVKIRKKPSTGQWFLTDQMLLADIRVPVSADPWA